MQERHYSKCKLDDLIAALGGFAIDERPTRTEQIKALFAKGRRPEEIAYLLGSTEGSIVTSLSRLGLRRRIHNPWTQAEIRLLLQLRADGNRYSKIARIIKTHAAATCGMKHAQIQKNLRAALGSPLRAA